MIGARTAAWRWLGWWMALGGGCALTLSASWFAVAAKHRTEDLLQQSAALQGTAAAAPPQAADFVASLGPAISAGRLVKLLDTSSGASGLSIAGVTISETPPSPTELGRMEAAVVLQGPYVATQRALLELHERLPSLQVKHIRMQPMATQSSSLQTNLVLSVWSAPLIASAPTPPVAGPR